MGRHWLLGGAVYVWATTGFRPAHLRLREKPDRRDFCDRHSSHRADNELFGLHDAGVDARWRAPSSWGSFSPAQYFQQISVGSFTKGLAFNELWANHLILLGFALGFYLVAALLLKKQEV